MDGDGRIEQRSDAAIAVAAIALSQTNDVARQRVLIMSASWRLALGRAVLADHAAGAAFGDAQRFHHVIDTGAATRRAQKFPRDASCRIILSSVRSETALRSRWFSRSSSFIRLA